MSTTHDGRLALPERRPLVTIAGVVGACVVLGAAGGLITAPQIETWYATLDKPGFTPPSWVFGPVWTLLYALQGVAAWLIWRAGLDRRIVRIALGLFTVQFVLNLSWSPAFFGLESPILGLAVIVPLWVAIVATMIAFSRVDRRAAALLVPYLAWVTFATALNYAIWTLN
ncbi:TspO/MBR family protein [Halococcus saccharolyticus]|uniref:Tryptophan-rich sensory protein n=1 Tax=Halococcus saccharolyticus DSM 5350 TaxID=1227455 RepID=M0MBA8_9EURY|nr:TspO/MBR family protein [Halococcus saccharolyticus]EMA42633.1 tryptophan-rich sensory protein [Halococcus saccharolyticus DSM 5350]